MPARALGTPANVVIERDGKTFTGAVVPDRDGVRVIFTVSGIVTDLQPGPYASTPVRSNATVIDDQGRAVAGRPRWTTGGYLRFEPTPTFHHTLVLESPEPDARHLVLAFDGPAGEWEVRLPLEPIEHEGVPGRTIEAVDLRRGVTVAARVVARSAHTTVVEVEAYLDPPSTAEGWARSYVMGIGPTTAPGRLSDGQIVLRDDAGNVHLERGLPVPEQTGGKQREAVVFPALPDAVEKGTIEVEVVWVHEGTDEIVTVPVPGDADIALAGCTGRVTVTRVAPREGQFPHLADGPATSAVHIVTRPLDPDSDRQLVYVPPADQRIGMCVTRCAGQPPTVDIPETTERLDAVTFRGGTIQIRGPWRLEIPLRV